MGSDIFDYWDIQENRRKMEDLRKSYDDEHHRFMDSLVNELIQVLEKYSNKKIFIEATSGVADEMGGESNV